MADIEELLLAGIIYTKCTAFESLNDIVEIISKTYRCKRYTDKSFGYNTQLNLWMLNLMYFLKGSMKVKIYKKEQATEQK